MWNVKKVVVFRLKLLHILKFWMRMSKLPIYHVKPVTPFTECVFSLIKIFCSSILFDKANKHLMFTALGINDISNFQC